MTTKTVCIEINEKYYIPFSLYIDMNFFLTRHVITLTNKGCGLKTVNIGIFMYLVDILN